MAISVTDFLGIGNMGESENFHRADMEVQASTTQQNWQEVETAVNALKKPDSEEVLRRVEKPELHDKQEIKRLAQELHSFLSKFFSEDENMSRASHETALREKTLDTYLVRGESGEIVSLLQSANVNVKSLEGQPDRLLFTTWYVATDPNYKGRPVTREMFIAAMQDTLKSAKEQNKEVLGAAGETVSSVEALLSRYYGLKRMYYQTEKAYEEVVFLAPPEDESTKGVPEHFMLRLIGNKDQLSTIELMEIFRSIYGEYTRPEYFTPTHSREEATEFQGKLINNITAPIYHMYYRSMVERIRKQVSKKLEKAKDAKIFLLDPKEKNRLIKEGATFKDANIEE